MIYICTLVNLPTHQCTSVDRIRQNKNMFSVTRSRPFIKFKRDRPCSFIRPPFLMKEKEKKKRYANQKSFLHLMYKHFSAFCSIFLVLYSLLKNTDQLLTMQKRYYLCIAQCQNRARITAYKPSSTNQFKRLS